MSNMLARKIFMIPSATTTTPIKPRRTNPSEPYNAKCQQQTPLLLVSLLHNYHYKTINIFSHIPKWTEHLHSRYSSLELP